MSDSSDHEEIDLAQIEELEEKLKKAKSSKDKNEEASICQQLTDLYRDEVGDMEKAVEYAKREVELRKELKEDKHLSVAYSNLSVCLSQLESFDEAVEAAENALKHAQASKDKETEAAAYCNFGGLWLSKYQVAEENKLIGGMGEDDEEDEKPKKKKKNQEEEEEEEEDDSGELLEILSKAIQYGEKALEICYAKDTDDSLMHSETAANANTLMAEAYLIMGENEKAVPHFERIREIGEKSKNDERIGEALEGLGKAYFEQAAILDNDDEDEEEEKEEEDLEEADKKKSDLIEKALGYFNERIEFAKKKSDNEGLATGYAGLISCYDINGDKIKMIDAQKKLIEIEESAGEGAGLESTVQLADMYVENTQYKEGMETYKKALSLAKKIGDEEMVDEIEDNIVSLQQLTKTSGKDKKRKTTK